MDTYMVVCPEKGGEVVYTGSWSECLRVSNNYPLPTNIIKSF
jgi:hypothetical protein